ncbi:MAG: tetratricopeptide repeat protein [Pyrinomonadaceae bacterium]
MTKEYRMILVFSLVFLFCVSPFTVSSFTGKLNRGQYTTDKTAEEYLKEGSELLINRKLPEAIKAFTKSLELKETAAAYSQRGTAHFYSGSFEKAYDDLDKAIELDPDNIEALKFRGVMFNADERFAEAIADYTRLIEIEPRNAYFYKYRADTYKKQENFDAAIADYTKALELKTALSYSYLIERGNLHYAKGDLTAAVKDYTDSIEMIKNTEALKKRAAAYCRLGEKEKAKADEDAVKKAGGSIKEPCS